MSNNSDVVQTAAADAAPTVTVKLIAALRSFLLINTSAWIVGTLRALNQWVSAARRR